MKTISFIRGLAIVGILGLLILQYTWFRNSYAIIEQEIIYKSNLSVEQAVNTELFQRVNGVKQGKVKVENASNLNDKEKEQFKPVAIQQTGDINSVLQEFALSEGRYCKQEKLDAILKIKFFENFGYIPNYKLFIIETPKSLVKEKFNSITKINSKQSAQVTLVNPLGSILHQSQMIVIVSIVLVIIIGVVLIYLLKSTVKEAKFVTFIKEYTHALTHELKTPISGIYMASSQLSSGVFEERPDARNRYYGMIRESSSKLLSTVDRILLVAKAEHSKITTNPTPTDVRIFIEKIADAHRSNNFRRKDVTITTSCLPGDLTANFDPFLMENVLNNLVDNAMKYSEQQVSIDIHANLVDDKLELRVKDTGFGIAENELKYIFDNFERGNKVQGKGIDGFGIGLNYVNKVVKAHKGTIEVQSQEGKGTEFTIRLPQ